MIQYDGSLLQMDFSPCHLLMTSSSWQGRFLSRVNLFGKPKLLPKSDSFSGLQRRVDASQQTTWQRGAGRIKINASSVNDSRKIVCTSLSAATTQNEYGVCCGIGSTWISLCRGAQDGETLADWWLIARLRFRTGYRDNFDSVVLLPCLVGCCGRSAMLGFFSTDCRRRSSF